MLRRNLILCFGLALLGFNPLAQAAEEKVLNIYNWNDYIAPDTIKRFEKETGIKVKYDQYDSNETLQAKLFTGNSGYDIVVPSIEFAGKQIQAGLHRRLDLNQLSNYSNLDGSILAKLNEADPGNAFLIPYMYFTVALAINETKVNKALGGKLPDDMWQLVFDPKYTSKLKSCGISFMDSPSDVFSMVNIYENRNANDYGKAALDAGVATLSKVRKDVRVFNASPIDIMANGEVCVALIFSGDAYIAKNRAEEAKNGQKIRYIIPKKGAVLSVDNLAIPKSSKHPQNAHKFINFILRPDVVAAISNTVFYANPNRQATALVKKEISSDPNIYLTPEIKRNLTAKKVIPADEQKELTTAFNKVKAAK